MKFAALFTFMLVLAFYACGTSSSNEAPSEMEAKEEQAWDEMMVVHDEVMPLMGQLNKLNRTLKTALEGNDELPVEKARLEEASRDLEAAEKSMWQWMHNIQQLGALRKNTDHEGIMEYLSAEKEKIEGVAEAMKISIENAKGYVDQLPFPAQ